jgi:hypothetical protein
MMAALATTAANSGWWSHHGAHTLLLAVPSLIIGAIAVHADIRGRSQRRRKTDRRRLTVALAGVFSYCASAARLLRS